MSLSPMHRYVGRVVHLIRQEQGMRQSELALLTGLKQPNLSRIENGLVSPRPATLDKIAKALGVEVAELHSEGRVQEVERKWAASLGPKHAVLMMAGKLSAVPLLDTTAGYPAVVSSNGEPQARLEVIMQLPPFGTERSGARHFALRVHGDSMQGSGQDSFRPGEVVVFATGPEVRAGELAFLILRDGGVFRRVEMPGPGQVRLVALNPSYQDRTVPSADVLGMWKLVRHCRSY